MANRSALTIQLRIEEPSAASRLHSNKIRGTIGDEWDAGYLLTLTEGGRAATLETTIDADISGPVKYLAVEDYDGVDTGNVALEEIDADTVCAAQIVAGTASADDIGKQGRLIQDATTGIYSVNLDATAKASIEVVDTEDNREPYGRYAKGTYNLVFFKFLPAVLEIAPPSVS